MLHGLTVLLGIMLWTFILAILLPLAYQAAVRNQDAIKDRARRMLRMFGR